jgi:uncharacterized protein
MVKMTSTKIKILSLTILWIFTALSAAGAYFASGIPTNYTMDQFMPKNHQLLRWDQESKKVFQISETAPHILLLSFNKGGANRWTQSGNLDKLEKLSNEIQGVKGVKSVFSLGNISSAFEQKGELLVANLKELQKHGYKAENIVKNPLYAPNLVSKDGLHAAVFVIPEALSQEGHKALINRIQKAARKAAPSAHVQVGGPAVIRTQLIDLLSREIMLFILLSLLCAIVVLKIMFHGYPVLLQSLYILVVANTLALGVMGFLGISFNILSSTMPIIVTVSALGILTHLLVRMGEAAHKSLEERTHFLLELVKEITTTVILTGVSTAVGFACLIPSDVQVISDYGFTVAMGVLVSSLSTMLIVPSLYMWVKWPVPRAFLHEPKRFAAFVTKRARILVPAIAVLTLIFAWMGRDLSWTAKLFDDLPTGHSALKTTDFISRKLGGVATVDFMVGGEKLKDPWKQPVNLRKLRAVSQILRERKDVGSVLTLSDFLGTGEKQDLPKTRESPLKQFLSSNEKWTRVAVRLPDLPADKNQAAIASIKAKLQTTFPGMTVRSSGIAAIVPPMNKDLSKHLMWGFFEALFGIVLVLAIAFRSLRWALVGIVPNLVPPAMLMGFLCLFDVPIKPGIAIIFSISLGIAFDNTIYILGRLKALLKERPRESTLPIYTLMKKETMPCLVSSLCLFAGFSIFLFSVFPVNRMFGLFVLISIIAGLLGDLVWLPAILKRYPWLLLENRERAKLKFLPFNLQETAMRLTPYIMLAVLGLIAFRGAYASGAETQKTISVQEILKKVENGGAPKSERVHLKMTIQESDGSKKERVLTILRKNDDDARALVRLQKPADLKGLSLLTVVEKGKEDQYLYLPSDKKSRRILGSNKKGKFLDSEIAFEDLSLSTYKEFNNKVVKDDGKLIEIESKAKPDSESSYGKIVTWVTSGEYRLEKVDYYDKQGKLLKRAQFKGYTKVENKHWRAKHLIVHNVQANRKTSLTMLKVSFKNIDADEVSLAALED